MRKTAFTLVEMVVAITVSIAMVTAIGSSVLLVTQAVPDGKSVLDATAEAARIAESISGELACALAFTAKTNRMVQFTVPDRNANGLAETIRYEWSGVPGDPLKRKYNNNAAMDVLENVYAFDLTYDIPSTSKTDTEVTSTDSSEQLLASFSGWPIITSTSITRKLDDKSWESEYFLLTPPVGTTSLSFTKAKMRMKRSATSPDVITTVGVHYSKSEGDYRPAIPPIGAFANVPSADLTTSFNWYTVNFVDTVATDLSRGEFCLVFKGPGTGWTAVEGLTSAIAPLNGFVEQWTTDSGSTWLPSLSLLHLNDLQFEVYGFYTTTDVHNNSVTTSLLKNVNIRLQVGSNASSLIQAKAGILNTPQVSGL